MDVLLISMFTWRIHGCAVDFDVYLENSWMCC